MQQTAVVYEISHIQQLLLIKISPMEHILEISQLD